MKRIVTYDIKSGHDYTDFYEFVAQHNGEQITESTYAITTSYNQEEFETKLKSLFRRGDSVYYISVNDKNRLFYKKIVL